MFNTLAGRLEYTLWSLPLVKLHAKGVAIWQMFFLTEDVIS